VRWHKWVDLHYILSYTITSWRFHCSTVALFPGKPLVSKILAYPRISQDPYSSYILVSNTPPGQKDAAPLFYIYIPISGWWDYIC
jgi:hypothetical protein